MEEWQIAHIKRNSRDLIRNTIIYISTLQLLMENDVLSQDDTDSIKEMPESGRSALFYRIIVTKEDSFDILIDVLEEGKQTGAVAILKRGYEPHGSESGCSSKTPHSSGQTKHLSDHPGKSGHQLKPAEVTEKCVQMSNNSCNCPQERGKNKRKNRRRKTVANQTMRNDNQHFQRNPHGSSDVPNNDRKQKMEAKKFVQGQNNIPHNFNQGAILPYGYLEETSMTATTSSTNEESDPWHIPAGYRIHISQDLRKTLSILPPDTQISCEMGLFDDQGQIVRMKKEDLTAGILLARCQPENLAKTYLKDFNIFSWGFVFAGCIGFSLLTLNPTWSGKIHNNITFGLVLIGATGLGYVTNRLLYNQTEWV